MFNLDQSIADWRRQMRAAGIKSPKVLDELESHLRDDLEQQMQAGSGAQKAFETAVLRIGNSQTLKSEFANAGQPNDGTRKLMAFIGATFVVLIVWMSAYTFSQCELKLVGRMFGFAAIGLILLVACGWKHIVRFLPVIQNKKRRMALGVAWAYGTPLIWGMLFGQFILPPLGRHLTGDQMLVAALWAVFPATVLLVLGLGLAMGERDREFLGVGKSPHKQTATMRS